MARYCAEFFRNVWIFIIGIAALCLTSFGAQAQDCVPTYTGCVGCSYFYTYEEYDPWSGEWVTVPVSDSSTICVTNSVYQYPFDAVPTAHGYATCYAYQAAPADGGQSCAPPAGTGLQNVFRWYWWPPNNDEFNSLDRGEGIGWANFYGVAFKTHTTQVDANMHQLYRCWWAGASDHFVSTDPNCEGLTNEGSYGWVSSIPRSGYVPLYRYYNQGATDHSSTTNPNPGGGWAYEHIQGYVPL